MSYLLGIDLGTTYTAAAVLRLRAGVPVAEPEMLGLGSHGSEMPSVVHSGTDGSWLVGDAAERRAMVEPDRVAREFKRRIGDPTPVSVGERAVPAEELAALVVRHVVDVAAAREGGPPARVTVTYPASWGEHKRELVRAAVDAVLSGCGVAGVELLPEPQAAAVCYTAAERVGPGSTIAVYDLGGGTFDAAVVRTVPGGGFALLGRPEGVEFLGGVDFDEVVFEHVRAGVPEAFEGLEESDPGVWAAVARLRRECREAKEALSADTEVSVPVWLPGGVAQGPVRLHRGEFEELIGPRVEQTVQALRRAVESAGLSADPDDPDDAAESGLSAVLLVGGSSRIPLVAQRVSEGLGRPVAVDADPKNVIAKGAALSMAAPSVAGEPMAAPSVTTQPMAGELMAAEQETGGAGQDPAAGYVTGEPVTEYVGYDEYGERPTSEMAHDPPTVVMPAVGDDPNHDGATTLSPEPRPDGARSATMLIGSGAVVAAVAVIAALVFWPDDQGVSNATPALPPVPTTVAPPPPTSEQASTSEPDRPTGERTTERPPDTGVTPPPQVPTQPTEPQDPTTSQVPTTSPTDPPTTTTTSQTPVPLPRPQ